VDGSRYDVVVVGGGPAGLSAALLLGRCCRRVLLCDAPRPRNSRSPVHGFLTRDGTDALELRRLGRDELARYPTVAIREDLVIDARREEGGFLLALDSGAQVRVRKLLLATGLVDELPPIPGLAALWGRLAFPCPYCDAWEFRGRRIGVVGRGPGALGLGRVTIWSEDVVLLSSGPSQIALRTSTSCRAPASA